jgi:hypothetical protein
MRYAIESYEFQVPSSQFQVKSHLRFFKLNRDLIDSVLCVSVVSLISLFLARLASWRFEFSSFCILLKAES